MVKKVTESDIVEKLKPQLKVSVRLLRKIAEDPSIPTEARLIACRTILLISKKLGDEFINKS